MSAHKAGPGTSQGAELIALGISRTLGPRPWAAVYEDDAGGLRLASPKDQDPATTYRLIADAKGTLDTR